MEMTPKLQDLLARLAAVSEDLDDRQQRDHGLRAGSNTYDNQSAEQARIRAMQREQAELRRQILACNDWPARASSEERRA